MYTAKKNCHDLPGRFFDDFLVTTLNATLAFVQVDAIAELVTQYLD